MPISNLQEETDFLIESYRRFRLKYANCSGPRNLAPYDHLPFPTSIPMHLSAFYWMSREFLRELANELNRLDANIEQLRTWSELHDQHDAQERMCMMMELIEPLATVAFSQPAALRSRFIFAMSHTSHQANLFAVPGWSEEMLEKDEKINYKSMELCCSHWPHFGRFLPSFGYLNDKNWQLMIRDFRNKYHHRIPPRFEHGHTQFIKRNQMDDGSTSYTFGSCHPISIKDCLPELRQQHNHGRQCFDAYSDLLLEQWSRLNTGSGSTGAI